MLVSRPGSPKKSNLLRESYDEKMAKKSVYESRFKLIINLRNIFYQVWKAYLFLIQYLFTFWPSFSSLQFIQLRKQEGEKNDHKRLKKIPLHKYVTQ